MLSADRQTNATKNITFFAKEIIIELKQDIDIYVFWKDALFP